MLEDIRNQRRVAQDACFREELYSEWQLKANDLPTLTSLHSLEQLRWDTESWVPHIWAFQIERAKQHSQALLHLATTQQPQEKRQDIGLD